VEYENVILDIKDRVATVTLNQPDRRNALSLEMVNDIESALGEIAESDEARVVVITGSGKAFSSGGDMKSMAEGMANPSSESREQILDYYRTALAVREVAVPTIASMNGHAIGAGLTLALACDMRIAAQEAKMGPTFIQIGLNPGMGTTYLLTRIVGLAKACELVFTAKVIEAGEAERIGLINKAVPRDMLAGETGKLAAAIAAGPPQAMKMAKRSLYLGASSDLETVLEYESFGQGVCTLTEDLKEGITAFLQKRDPEFKGE